MTEEGGNLGYGNLFSVGTGGTNYKSLVSFTGTGGNYPGWVPCGDLTLSGTTFYGMTSIGGVNGNGNIFSVGTDGTSYHSLVSFNWANGAYPQGSLTLGGTTLYGMTEEGGNLGYGNLFSVGTGGTNYKSLVSFTGTSGSAIGQSPNGGLTLSGTTLYGMTEEGGAAGQGNIFSVGIDGSEYQNRYSFSGGTDGGMPFGDFTLSGGTLFGTGSIGGTNGDGTVFALTLPATPTPEPGTLALVAAAAVALVSYCWRVMRGRLARGGEARRL
jgi:uncharacterized repeat protein (TIGR03803 family)